MRPPVYAYCHRHRPTVELVRAYYDHDLCDRCFLTILTACENSLQKMAQLVTETKAGYDLLQIHYKNRNEKAGGAVL